MHTPDTPAVTISDRLDGRRALVTGASKGTGAAVAARLREAGATVLGVARTAPAPHPGPRDFVAADLTSPDAAARLAEHAVEQLGRVDILVHTLGGSRSPSGGFTALADVIAAHLAAHEARDAERELACYAEQAAVTDEGRTYRGTAQIRLARPGGERVHVHERARRRPQEDARHWTAVRHLEGDFPGGVVDLRYRYTVDDQRITELVIAP